MIQPAGYSFRIDLVKAPKGGLIMLLLWMAALMVQVCPAVGRTALNHLKDDNRMHSAGEREAYGDSSIFHVLILYENGGHHLAYSKGAIPFIDRWSKENDFAVRYIQDPALIDSTMLSRFQLFIQLDYPPYSWPQKAMQAFRTAISEGKIGWLGLHHSTLLGEFDGYPMWNWFSWFMGGIRFKNYIADFASAYVDIKDTGHPVMRGVPSRFFIQKEEWYTYDKVPGPYIHVLATVDESSYQPAIDIKMHGPHPVIWTNTKVHARNLYIFMGHDPDLWQNKAYKRLFWNALFWAASEKPLHGFNP